MATRGLHVVITGDPRGFQAALAKAGAATGTFAAKQKSTSAKVASAGTAMSKGITLPLLAAAGVSVKFAATFEKQMSSLGAVAGASGSQMDALRKQAIKAGSDTAYSAREAAIAQTELAKGGVSAANILKGALGGALALAAAGELDLGEAAEITANALNLFGMKGADATKVADAMATAANTTTADVDDFGMALKQAGSVASTAGYSFTDTMVGLEAMAKAGIKNSDAGTSMKSAMLQLIGPSKQAAERAKELGLNFVGSNGKMKDAASISAMLRDKLGGMGDAQRVATLKTLAGADGVRYLTSLYKAGPKALQGYEKGLTKQGTAADVARKKQDNFAGQLEQLKGSLETLAIVVGSTLIPPLTNLARVVTPVINQIATAFQALPPHVQTVGLAVAGLLAVIGPLVVIGASLVTAFTTVGGALAAVTAPVWGTIAVIVALGAAFVIAYRKSEAFRGFVQGAFAAVKQAGTTAATWLIANVPRAFEALKNAGRRLAAVLGPVVSAAFRQIKATIAVVIPLIAAIGARFRNLLSIVTPVVRAIARVVGPVLGAAFRGMLGVVRSVVGAIGPILSGLLGIVRGVIQVLTGILRGDFGTMWAGVKSIFSGAVRALGGVVRGAVGVLKAAASAIASGILGALRAMIGQAAGIASAVVSALAGGIRSAAASVAKAAADMVGGAIDAAKRKLHIKSPSRVFHDIGTDTGAGFTNGIKASAASARAAAGELGGGVVHELESQIADARKAGDALAEVFARQDKAAEVAAARAKTRSKKKDTRAEGRRELRDLAREADRTNRLAKIDFQIAGLERVKAFGDAIADVRNSLGALTESAGQAFRETAEKGIDAELGKALLAMDTTTKGALERGRKGVAADPRVAELAGLRARADASSRDAEDAEITERLAKAKMKVQAADAQMLKAQQALDRVQASGSQRLITAAQQRLALTQTARNTAALGVADVETDARKLADARRVDELEAELENAQAIAQDRADAQREGLDKQVADFQSALATQLTLEADALEQRKKGYKSFADAVKAILAPLGLVFDTSADQEAAIGAPAPKAPKNAPGTKAPRRRRRNRAQGGLIKSRLGEFARINEVGTETVWLPRGTRVETASTTAGAGGGGPLIGQVNIHEAGKLDEQAIAERLGFRLATRRR